MTQPPQTLYRAREAAYARRLEVARLRRQGIRDQYRIAQLLGVSKSTISNDWQIVNSWWREQAALDVDEEIWTELVRLDALLEALWPKAESGDLQAVDRMLGVIDRRIRILGLEAPKRVNVDTQGVVRQYVGIDPANFDIEVFDVPFSSEPADLDALEQRIAQESHLA